jgi:hypothetical protein
MRFFGSSLLIVALIVALVPAPAAAQGYNYGVKGKSSVEFTDLFVSGASQYDVSLNYRATDVLSLIAGFETLSAPGVSGTGVGFGLRYYPPVASEKFEPYLFGAFVSATVSITGFGTASGSGVQFGVGASGKASDLVTLRGSVYVTSIAGSSVTNFDVGLKFNVAENYYVPLGIVGGGGTSAFYLGFGSNF